MVSEGIGKKTMRKIVFLLFFLLNAVISSAQWQPLNGPFGTWVGCIAVDGTKLYAGVAAQVSEIYYSPDSGNNWILIADGLPQDNSSFGKINFKDTVVFASSDTKLYRANTNDFLWTQCHTGLPEYIGVSSILDYDSLIILGSNHGVYASGDLGDNWIQKNNGLSDSVIGSLFRDGDSLYAGSLSGKIFISGDAGTTWSPVVTGDLPESCINAIVIRDSVFFVVNEWGVYRSVDAGLSWTRCFNGSWDYDVSGITYDSTYLYVETWNEGVCRSPDNGDTWSPVNDGLLDTPVMAVVPGNNHLFACTMGGVFVSDDQGDLWKDCNNGLGRTPVTALVRKDQALFAGTYLGVYRSFDDGVSWTIRHSDMDNYLVYCLARKDSLVFAGTSELGMFRTRDNGNTWTQINNGIIYQADVISIGIHEESVYACTTKGLYRTEDNGDNWVPVRPDEKTYYSIAFNDPYIFTSLYDSIIRSSDNGVTWVPANTGLTNPFIISMAAKDSFVFAGAWNKVYRSRADSINWEQMTNGLTGNEGNVNSFLATDTTLFVARGWEAFISTNDGDEWFDVSDGIPQYCFVNSLLADGNDLYAGTYHGVWKRPLSQMYFLNVHPDTVKLEYSQNSTAQLIIRTNAAWSVNSSMPEWVTVDKQEGFGSDTLVFTATQSNPGENTRSESIAITSIPAADTVFTISQKGKPAVIEDYLSGQIILCPNPSADGMVKVKSSIPVNQLMIFNITGSLLDEKQFSEDHFEETLFFPESGVYFIMLKADNTTLCRKIIIL
jgi:photosystem II stability/assembly factor-like uncharacterized protein